MTLKLFIYFVSNIIIFFTITKFSYKYNLIDKPNKRKMHKIPVAFTGGLSLSIIYIISIYIFNFNYENLSFILSIGLFISLVGLVDDKFELNIGGKLSLQIIPIFYLITFRDMSLINLGDYGYLNINLNSFSIPFTLLSVLFLINSFNYFDGIDGTLSLSVITIIAILFFLTSDQEIRNYLIVILIPICIFLIFNFSFFKIEKLFLGDSGSLLLGFIISFTLIFLSNSKMIHPILIAWSVAIFVYEFLSLNYKRLKEKRNPFKPGKDHLHHILYKKTNSIFLTNFIICFINIFLFSIGYISFILINAFTSLLLYLFCFPIFLFFRKKYLAN